MVTFQVVLTDEQDAALTRIADDAGKTSQEVVDEQMVYYLKAMLDRELKAHGIPFDEDLEGTDTEKAQIAAVMLKAKEDFLKSKNGE